VPPFEPLPRERRAVRLRAVRDALIVSGWMAALLVPLVIIPVGLSLGYDAYSYWSIDPVEPYARTFDNLYRLGAFRYAPPIALLFAPLGWLPWWLFLWLWLWLMVATLVFLGRRWTLALLALPPVALELYHGNVHLLMAVAVALGFRHPAAWSFVLLTKVTPGIGLLWFAVRREWRALAIALGATAAVAIAAHLVAPDHWPQFIAATLSNADERQDLSIPPPLPVRLPLAVLLVVWGARTDRPWTVALASTLALPVIWPHGLVVALAALPFARLGDRAASLPGWRDVARARDLALVTGVVLGAALIVALVASGPLSELLTHASQNIAPELNRPPPR
jgi:hypothetical protein